RPGRLPHGPGRAGPVDDARRRTPGAPDAAVRTGRRLPGVPRFRGPRTAADRGPARPAPAAPQRLDRPPLGRPGLPPGLPLVCQRALLGRPDSDAARATGGTGRGAVAAVLTPPRQGSVY